MYSTWNVCILSYIYNHYLQIYIHVHVHQRPQAILYHSKHGMNNQLQLRAPLSRTYHTMSMLGTSQIITYTLTHLYIYIYLFKDYTHIKAYVAHASAIQMHTNTHITYEYIIWYQYGHDNISKFWTIILNCLKELASLNRRLKSIYVKKLEAFTLQLLHGSWTTWPGLKLMRFCQRHIAHMSHISRNVWRIQSSKLIYST